MAEARIVQHAERTPSMCVACGDNTGPFVDFDVETFPIATAMGQIPIVDGSVYLCIGTRERPGCVIQAARKSGLVVDIGVVESLSAEVDQLRAERDELSAIAKKKTITLADAERILSPTGDF